MKSAKSSPYVASSGLRGGRSSAKTCVIAAKNSSPTTFSVTGKRLLSAFIRPLTMLLRWTAKRRAGTSACGATIPQGGGRPASSSASANDVWNGEVMIRSCRRRASGGGEYLLRRVRFGAQGRPIRDVIVPLDQSRYRAGARDNTPV